MSRKERRAPRAERIRTLVAAGDHGTARRDARAILADPGAPGEEREAARGLLASLAPDRGAVAAGLVGVAGAVVISVLVLLGR